jgi:uncharacterized repeat protein (TIGR03847 family)
MIDFGLVDAVDAEAIGPPGERTFRLVARSAGRHAMLWLEKEQLAALGRGLSQLLAERSTHRGEPEGKPAPFGEQPETPDVELQVARLGIDFLAEQEHLVLLADDREAIEGGESPRFRLELSRPQTLSVIRRIRDAVSAGRPRCPLCGQPLEAADAEHFCPRTNGHSEELPLPEEGETG